MDIKGITYLKSISPIEELDIPSPKTIELLAKFTQDPDFRFIDLMRNQYHLPEEGLNLKPYVGKNFEELPYVNNTFVKLAFEIIANDLKAKIGLSEDFVPQLLLLVFFNAILDVKYFDGFISQPIRFIVGKEKIASTMFKYPYEIASIILPFSISQNQLVRWIKENWGDLSGEMDQNLTTNQYILKMHKNTRIALEVIELKENKKLTYSKISDELTNMYPEDERVADEAWIKKLYHDYKDILNTSVQKGN